jgi:hypothetical protein
MHLHENPNRPHRKNGFCNAAMQIGAGSPEDLTIPGIWRSPRRHAISDLLEMRISNFLVKKSRPFEAGFLNALICSN